MDNHKVFSTSTATLQEATADVHRLRKEIADAATARQEHLEKLHAAEDDLETAQGKLLAAKGALAVAITSADEKKALEATQQATVAVQNAHTLYEAKRVRYFAAPDMAPEEAALEAAMGRAISCIVGEELNRLPEDTLSVFYRAWTCYQGCSSLEWEQWLALVIPKPDSRDRAKTYAEVVKAYGLAE